MQQTIYTCIPDGDTNKYTWTKLGDDVRVPIAHGHAATLEQARRDAINPALYPPAYRCAVFYAGGSWRWCVWRGGRPVYCGKTESRADAEHLASMAGFMTYRPWGDYQRPYTTSYISMELIDPLTVKEN